LIKNNSIIAFIATILNPYYNPLPHKYAILNTMLIIGITGTNAAGKGTVVEILKKDFGFEHLSVREYLAKEIAKRNLEINRENLIQTANDIRKKHSPSYIVEQLYKEALRLKNSVIIESIRTEGEVEALKKNPDFILIAVDADRKTRYERSLKRNSETDQLTYEDFVKMEEKEMHSNNKGEQNLIKCIELADVIIYNNGTVDDLKKKVNKYLVSSKIITK
jgi:dephospho-CoA kinase